MTYEAAILYAHQRMREIGKSIDQYHFEPVRVGGGTTDEVAGGYFEISAYNEIWILVYPEKYFGVFILADTSAFNSDDAKQSGLGEFTGIIRFVKSAAEWNLQPSGGGGVIVKAFPIEFLRVLIY